MTSSPNAFNDAFLNSRVAQPSGDSGTSGAQRDKDSNPVRSELNGIHVGLFGFPNSGKTSFLYSLKYGGSKEARSRMHAKGQRSWILGPTGVDFARLVGTPGERQIATPAGVFKEAEFCRVTRVWIPGTSIGSSRMIILPEVSGEVARSIVDGETEKYATQAENYLTFLAKCDILMCLVGIDGPTTGSSSSSIRPDSAIKPALEGFERLVAEVLKRRRSATPLAVSILITKVDLLKESGALDDVTLMASQSAIATLARTKERKWLAPMVLSGTGEDEIVRFRVNALMSAPQAQGDLDVQEAITADFLRCHAPSSAKSLSGFCKLPGVSVRFFLSAPYGRHFVGTMGENVMPPPDDLKTRMVYEPLENALERAWAAQSGSRLRRNIGLGVAASLALFLGGPFLLGRFETNFDRAVAERADFKKVQADLDWIEWHPLFAVEQSLFSARREKHSQRLLELRLRMLDGAVAADHDAVADLEDRALELHPDAQLRADRQNQNIPLKVLVANRSQAELLKYLKTGGSPSELGACHLTGHAVHEIRDELKSFLDAPEPKNWNEIAKRVQVVSDALGATGASAAREYSVQCSEEGEVLKHALARAGAFAAVRIARATDLARPTRTAPQTDTFRQNVLLSGDLASGKWLDETSHGELRSRWNEVNKRIEQGSATPGFSESLQSMSPHDWTAHLLEQEAQRSFETWMLKIEQESTKGFLDRTLSLDAQHDGASKYLEGAMGEITALDSHGNTWMVDPIRPDVLSLLEQAAFRSRLLATLQGDKGLDASTRSKLPDAFDRSRKVTADWISTSGGNSNLSVTFERLSSLQQERAEQLLGERISVALKEDRQPAAKEMLDLLTAISDPANESLGVYAALLDITKAASEKTPDLSAYRSALKSLLGMPDQFKLVQATLANRLAAAPALSALLPVTFEALSTSRVSDQDKRDWASSFVGSIGKRLEEIEEESLKTIVVEMNALGLPLKDLLPSLVAEILSRVMENQSEAELKRHSAQVRAVLNGAKQASPTSDHGVTLLRQLLVKVQNFFEGCKTAEDLAADDQGRRPLRFLLMLDEEQVDSLELRSIAAALKRHELIIRDNGLLKVQKAGITQFWLSAEEWDTEDLVRLAKDEPSKFEAWTKHPADLLAEKPARIDKFGKLTKLLGNESDASLGLDNVASAKNLLNIAGLRLPTRLEWESVPQPPETLEFKLSGEGRFKAKGPELKDLGDESGGFIGLRFGVREWVNDSYPLCGDSNLKPQQNGELVLDSRGNPPDIEYDCGVRPALDVTPRELQQALSSSNTTKP